MLALNQLTFARNDCNIFSPVSFTLKAGELLQITGANGSGKSTLLRLIAGLIEPTEGRLEIHADFNYIGHSNAHQGSLTARENLQVAAAFLGITLTNDAQIQILKQAGIEHLIDTQVKYFSAGQARRLALARLLIQPSTLWLLDEPTAGLDISAQRWFEEILATHLSRGGMAVVVTHQVMDHFKNSTSITLTQCDNNANTTPYLPAIVTEKKMDDTKNASILTLAYYEILATYREAHAWLTPLLFFVMAATLFPLAVGANIPLLHTIAPSMIWVIALLAILLSTDTIFRTDIASGRLDFVLSHKNILSDFVISKILCHWITHALPLVLLSPIIGGLFGLSLSEMGILTFSVFTGTFILSLIGSLGAAIVAGIRGHGLLLPILIMPFYIPVLIFGTNMVLAYSQQQPISAYIAILIALTLLSATFTPLFTQLALKTGVNQ
ncbi:MAG: heme ABC exporter ATP-binding protein CcmA [Gammaproteobacteria bacterium]|nr:heme ABC exporter ATP-binding protein CcmA [Gammaproteobacteria bacterium]